MPNARSSKHRLLLQVFTAQLPSAPSFCRAAFQVAGTFNAEFSVSYLTTPRTRRHGIRCGSGELGTMVGMIPICLFYFMLCTISSGPQCASLMPGTKPHTVPIYNTYRSHPSSPDSRSDTSARSKGIHRTMALTHHRLWKKDSVDKADSRTSAAVIRRPLPFAHSLLSFSGFRRCLYHRLRYAVRRQIGRRARRHPRTKWSP